MPSLPYIPGDTISGGANPLPVGALSVTEEDMMAALGDFLAAILPNDVPILNGQANRVPMPIEGNFVIFTPGSRTQLSTTLHDYFDAGAEDPASGRSYIQRQMSIDTQIDIYGPQSADNAQIIVNLYRDAYGVEFLAPLGVCPLYCNDANQMPLINGEKQYEQRWMITATMQANPYVSTAMLFADKVTPVLVEADQ